MTKRKFSINVATFKILEHNYRKSYTANEAFKDEPNDYSLSYDQTQKRKREIKQMRVEAYTKNTGQKMQEKQKKKLDYSCVINVNGDTTAQDVLDSVGAYLKEQLGVEIYSVAVHRDEGYIKDKQTGQTLSSGYDFFFDKKSGKYFADKNYTKLIAKDINELKENFEIVKNYHAHIEFCGIREDGSSIKHPCFADKKKPRTEWKYKALDKGYVGGFLNKYTMQNLQNVLNEHLENIGKEPVTRVKYNDDPNKPATAGIKNIKELHHFESKEKNEGIDKFTEKEKRRYEIIKSNANVVSQRNYKWNKTRRNEIIKAEMEISNDEFAQIDENHKHYEIKREYFKALANLRTSFDPSSQDENALKDVLAKLKKNAIQQCELKNEVNLWQNTALKDFDYAVENFFDESLDDESRLEFYDVIQKEKSKFENDENIADSFKRVAFTNGNDYEINLDTIDKIHYDLEQRLYFKQMQENSPNIKKQN